LAGIIGLAFVVRLVPVLRGGGIFGLHSYDDGVYFAAAIAFVGGRFPYSDFLLLHPPGILYVLSPFAALAAPFGDANAFATVRLAFMALGAVNAGLVTLVAGRMGRRAALFAGSLYVVWQIAANVERTTWLVAPQNTLLLLALFILGRSAPDGNTNDTGVRRAAAAGVLLGLGFGIQLWGVVPLAIAVVWQVLAARRRGRGMRAALACLLAGGVAAAIVWLPFLLVAGPQAVRQVVLDQLGRPPFSGSMMERLQVVEGLRIGAAIGRALPATVVVAIYVAIAVAVASVIVWAAWRRDALRPSATLLAVQATLLVVLPPFHHYAGWLAPAGAVAIGGAFDTLATRVRHAGRASSVVVVLYSFGIAALLVSSVARPVGTPIDRARLATAIAGARCVTADAPVLLILTGALQRDLQNGCPLVLDPAGTSFDLDRGSSRPRPERPEYQQAMEAYYGSSDAALFVRRGRDGLNSTTWAAIRGRLPMTIKSGRVTILVRNELVPAQ
jgi:alpha-1,2-mannosyltransferase